MSPCDTSQECGDASVSCMSRDDLSQEEVFNEADDDAANPFLQNE